MNHGENITYDNLLPDGTDQLVRIKDIVIPKSFSNSRTRQEKIFKALEYYETHGCFDKPISVKKRKRYGVVLVDEYSRYIIAKYILDLDKIAIKYI